MIGIMKQMARMCRTIAPLVLLLWMVNSSAAYADPALPSLPSAPSVPSLTGGANAAANGDTCTNFHDRFSQATDPDSGSANNQGLLSQIYTFIKENGWKILVNIQD